MFGTEEEVERNIIVSNNYGELDPSKTYNYNSPGIEQTSIQNMKKDVKIGDSKIEKISIPMKGSLTGRILKEGKDENKNADLLSTKNIKPIAGNIQVHKRKSSVSRVNLVYASEPEKNSKISTSRLPQI